MRHYSTDDFDIDIDIEIDIDIDNDLDIDTDEEGDSAIPEKPKLNAAIIGAGIGARRCKVDTSGRPHFYLKRFMFQPVESVHLSIRRFEMSTCAVQG